MFARPMVLNRGIDNTVKFQFKNNDQKKVAIHDKTITFNIVNAADHTTHLTRTMSIVDGNNGIAKVVIAESDLYNIKAQNYNWSVKVVNPEGDEQPGYMDDNLGARGSLRVEDGVFPTFLESVVGTFTANVTNPISSKPRLNNNTALHTAQFYFDAAYTGSVLIEGTMDDVVNTTTPNWFTIKTVAYTAEASPAYTTWSGVYNGVRFTKTDTTNTVTSVLYRY